MSLICPNGSNMTVTILQLLENHKTKSDIYTNVAIHQFKVSLSGEAEATTNYQLPRLCLLSVTNMGFLLLFSKPELQENEQLWGFKPW